MSKVWFHRETNNPANFDSDANLEDWPDYQEYPVPEVRDLAVIIRTRQLALTDSDWMAASDRTMTQEQRDYRQAWRNVTEQAAFVEGRYNDVVFPEKPENPGFGGV